MKRFFSPLLFLMANTPNAEKNLELLLYMLQTTSESVKNIKSGIDNFHASFLKMAEAAAGPAPGHTPVENKPPAQTPEPEVKTEPAVKPEPPVEPAVSPGPVSIQMPPPTGAPAS